ncbi:Uncharacterised protein [Mycobacteroides abscessus subsp. massiliense]|nr:Uncharacterised protein [Mycobacteroides abscessus subsp. massiliense]
MVATGSGADDAGAAEGAGPEAGAPATLKPVPKPTTMNRPQSRSDGSGPGQKKGGGKKGGGQRSAGGGQRTKPVPTPTKVGGSAKPAGIDTISRAASSPRPDQPELSIFQKYQDDASRARSIDIQNGRWAEDPLSGPSDYAPSLGWYLEHYDHWKDLSHTHEGFYRQPPPSGFGEH